MDSCKLKIATAVVNHLQTLLHVTLLTTVLIAVILFVSIASLRKTCRTLQAKIKRSLSLPLQCPISEQSQDMGLLVLVSDVGSSTSQRSSRATSDSRDHHENSTLSREAVYPMQQLSTDKGELVVSNWYIALWMMMNMRCSSIRIQKCIVIQHTWRNIRTCQYSFVAYYHYNCDEFIQVIIIRMY